MAFEAPSPVATSKRYTDSLQFSTSWIDGTKLRRRSGRHGKFAWSLALLALRVAFALYSLALTVISLVLSRQRDKWAFFFTNLSFLGLTVYFLLTASFSAVNLCGRSKRMAAVQGCPLVLRFMTTMHVTATTFSVVVTVLYWTLIFKQTPLPSDTLQVFTSVNLHATNLLFMGIDVFLNNIHPPWRAVAIAPLITIVYGCWGFFGSAVFRDPQNPAKPWFVYFFLDYTKAGNWAILVGIVAGSTLVAWAVVFVHRHKHRPFYRELFVQPSQPPANP